MRVSLSSKVFQPLNVCLINKVTGSLFAAKDLSNARLVTFLFYIYCINCFDISGEVPQPEKVNFLS